MIKGPSASAFAGRDFFYLLSPFDLPIFQCFLDGKLLPSQSDVKIELVPEVSALMEHPVREMGAVSSSGMAFARYLVLYSFKPFVFVCLVLFLCLGFCVFLCVFV